MDFTIYHNPECSNSRNTLALLRQAGVQPDIVEYLQYPLNAEQLRALFAKASLSVRDAMRDKETVYRELKLDNLALSEQQLLDAIAAHPALMNRPFVVTNAFARLCRPPETVFELLPAAK